MYPGRKRAIHPLLPQDPTPEEYGVLMHCVGNLYNKLSDPTDKFLIAFVFELGYTQSMAANSLNVSNAAVSKRINRIRVKLKIKYKID